MYHNNNHHSVIGSNIVQYPGMFSNNVAAAWGSREQNRTHYRSALMCINRGMVLTIFHDISVKDDIWGPFYKHGLNLITPWIRNHIPSKALDEITYPFPNFNATANPYC